MGVILAHPTGNEFFRAAATGFYKAGQLQAAYTSLASFPGTFLYNAGGLPFLKDIRRRALNSAIKHCTHIHPWKETGRLLAIKAGLQKLTAHETGIFSTDAVYRSLDKYVAGRLNMEKAKGGSAIYAYEDGAAYAFEKAKALDMQCLYDLPIGHWRWMRNMLSEEAAKNPEWAATLGGLKDSPEKLRRKDAEISMADTIIVASSFTAATLSAYPGKLPDVRVIPYGFPPARKKEYTYKPGSRPLKVLFVGGLSQRKGLSYLFQSVNGFKKHISLTVVGRGNVNACEVLRENLSMHNWIETLPHCKVLELMREHDVLIFPSLFEGFGLVITEAMSQGMPVITTERTAGQDIIEHGKNGWLVPAGDAGAIKKIIEEILLQPGIVEAVGKAALKTAEKRPWGVYGRELAAVVSQAEA